MNHRRFITAKPDLRIQMLPSQCCGVAVQSTCVHDGGMASYCSVLSSEKVVCTTQVLMARNGMRDPSRCVPLCQSLKTLNNIQGYVMIDFFMTLFGARPSSLAARIKQLQHDVCVHMIVMRRIIPQTFYHNIKNKITRGVMSNFPNHSLAASVFRCHCGGSALCRRCYSCSTRVCQSPVVSDQPAGCHSGR